MSEREGERGRERERERERACVCMCVRDILIDREIDRERERERKRETEREEGRCTTVQVHAAVERTGHIYHARPFVGVFEKSILRDLAIFWRYTPTKWLQERHNGSKNDAGMPSLRALRGDSQGQNEAHSGLRRALYLFSYQ